MLVRGEPFWDAHRTHFDTNPSDGVIALAIAGMIPGHAPEYRDHLVPVSIRSRRLSNSQSTFDPAPDPKGETQLLQKLTNLLLTTISCLIGFIICEVAYRGLLVWQENARWKRPQEFYVYADSIYDFDATLGYRYRPGARVDVAFLKKGTPRRCLTIVTGALGSAGKGIDPAKLAEVRFIVLGDSFTAMVHQDETWPDILASLIEAHSGNAVSILNLSRDGYGVLQMFDQAAQLVHAGHRPQAFIISITGADLVRSRFWRMTLERNGAVEVFTSTQPSLDIAPETHARTVFVDRRVTRSWCEALRASGRTDDTATRIELAFDATRRTDKAFFGHKIDVFSLRDCFLCDRIRHGELVRETVRRKRTHSLMRFQDDPGFAENLAAIRASGMPIWLVYLPVESELRNARKRLSQQDESLLESLKGAVDRYIELTPETPMGDAAVAFTLLPDDTHPSHAGLEYYAYEMYRRIVLLDHQR
jgi:hypothetical protein